MTVAHYRRFVLAAAAMFAIACGADNNSTGLNASVAGRYSLETYNGKPLPFTLTDTIGGNVYLTTFQPPFIIIVNGDGTSRIIATSTFSFNGQSDTSTDTTDGRWSASGNTLHFASSDGSAFTATWNGSDQLTINDPPDVLIFRKQ